MTDITYENVSDSRTEGGKTSYLYSKSRVGRSGDGKSPTAYEALTLSVSSVQTVKNWFCHSHSSYTEKTGTVPGLQVQIEHNGPRMVSLTSSPPDFIDNTNALSMAFKKSSSAQMQIGTELAEVFKTAATISTVVKESLRFIVDFKKSLTSKRHRKRFIKRVLNRNSDDIASAYMAFRFGIRPLVYATQSVLDLHNEGIKKPLLFHGNGNSTANVSDNGYACGQAERVRLTYQVTDTELFARSELGLSASELAATVWELLPLSWALDYFLPLGDYIQALSRRLSRCGVTFVNMMRSLKSKASYSSNNSATWKVCFGQHDASNSSSTSYSSEHYIRTIGTIEPYPPLPVNFNMTDSLNPYQILDLMALAKGIRR